MSSIQAPLYGLVLAGGRSSRMQRDKAALTYHQGHTQLERAMSLLAPHVRQSFVSVRPDQSSDPVRARFPQIPDQHHNLGPIAGILAAQEREPRAAWLVVACDLPFLDEVTLSQLVGARQPDRLATAYRSSHNGSPEPLCAIYEPRSRGPLADYVASGKDCPRKFLLNSDAHLIDQPNPRALDNINTPEELSTALSVLSTPAARPVRVQYYALLREQAGRSSETVVTAAPTARELYLELQARYPFSLAPEMLRVAVNAEFGDWDRPLAANDAVVFIPPVAGG